MASSRVTIDTDIILLRQIYARDPLNGLIPNQHILISDGAGAGYWNSISSIYQISSFRQVRGNNGSTFHADQFNNILNVSTTGVGLDAYVDPATSTLMFNNLASPIQLQIATIPVPIVSRSAATVMPGSQILSPSTSQSTFKFLGVGDITLSTVTDLNATFVSISTFTSAGWQDISAAARAWQSSLSTLGNFTSFVSTLPDVTPLWNWSNVLAPGLPMSTVDGNNLYSTGNVYFSTFTFSLSNFQRYIRSESSTKLAVEFRPTYFFDRMYLGTDYGTMVKPISSFIQYETTAGREIMPSSFHYDYVTTQQSNAFTSNSYATPLRLDLDTKFVLDRMARDGPNGYYTLYHYMPGGMARFSNDGCDRFIDGRGGLSNAVYDNRTSKTNAVTLQLYNN